MKHVHDKPENRQEGGLGGVMQLNSFRGAFPRHMGWGILHMLEEALAYLVVRRAQGCMWSGAVGRVGCRDPAFWPLLWIRDDLLQAWTAEASRVSGHSLSCVMASNSPGSDTLARQQDQRDLCL